MTRLKLWLAAIGATILAIITFGQIQRRDGRKEAEHEQLQEDVETAKRIDRVRASDTADDARVRLSKRNSGRDL